MNKTIVVIIVVVAIVCLGIPPVIGCLTERGLRMHADTVEALPDSPYEVDVIEYDRRVVRQLGTARSQPLGRLRATTRRRRDRR